MVHVMPQKLLTGKGYAAFRSHRGETQVFLVPFTQVEICRPSGEGTFHSTDNLPSLCTCLCSQSLHCEPRLLEYVNLHFFNTLCINSTHWGCCKPLMLTQHHPKCCGSHKVNKQRPSLPLITLNPFQLSKI